MRLFKIFRSKRLSDAIDELDKAKAEIAKTMALVDKLKHEIAELKELVGPGVAVDWHYRGNSWAVVFGNTSSGQDFCRVVCLGSADKGAIYEVLDLLQRFAVPERKMYIDDIPGGNAGREIRHRARDDEDRFREEFRLGQGR